MQELQPSQLRAGQNTWVVATIIVLSSFLVLFLFQPFGEVRHNFAWRGILRIASYAVASGGVFLLFQCLLFPRLQRRMGNTLLFSILAYSMLMLSMVLVVFLLKNYWMEFTVLTLEELAIVTFRVFSIGLVPALLLFALEYRAREEVTMPDELILKSVDRNPVYLKLPLRDVLAIRSAENYITVVKQEGSGLKEILLRNSLSRIERELPYGFVRVHRSHIVNLQRVSEVTSNTQGGLVRFGELPLELRISRRYCAALTSAWQRIKHAAA